MDFIGAAILVIISAFLGPSAVEYLKFKILKRDSDDPLKRDLISSSIISEELEDIRDKIAADRVWISMFHNGGHFIHGSKTMQKISILHETTKLGVVSGVLLFSDLPVTLFSKSIRYLMDEPLIKIVNVDFNDKNFSGLSAIHQALGVKSSYVVALFDICDESLVGVLGVDYNVITKLDQDNTDFLLLRSQRISGYISNFIKT